MDCFFREVKREGEGEVMNKQNIEPARNTKIRFRKLIEMKLREKTCGGGILSGKILVVI